MASTYSPNLAIELIGTGDQAGTWSVTTNTNLGTLIEQSISGYVTQAITDGSGANTTITIPNGATGVARNMVIEMTGALTFSTTSLIVPANKKLYFIFNNTSGGFAVTVKVSGQTGVLVPNGKKVILTSNGTDIVEAANQVVGAFGVGGALTVTGQSNLSATTGASIGASNSGFSIGALGGTDRITYTTGTTLFEFLTSASSYANIKASSATLGGTLGVTGTSTMAAINASGLVSAAAGAKVNLDGNSFQLVGKFQNNNSGTGTSVVALSSDTTYYKAGLALQRADFNGAGTLYLLNRASNDAANVAITDVVMQFSQTGAATIPGTLGVGSANAVAYGREQIFGTIAKATTTDEVTLFTGSSDATGALGLRITNKNHATAGSRAVFLEAAEPGVAIRTLQLNNSGYTIDGSGNTVIPGTLGVTGTSTMASITSSGTVSITGANPGGWATGFRTVVDNNGGEARIYAYGADATTRGSFNFYSLEADGGNNGSVLSIAIGGAVTIPGTLTVSGSAAATSTLSVGTTSLNNSAFAVNGTGKTYFATFSDFTTTTLTIAGSGGVITLTPTTSISVAGTLGVGTSSAKATLQVGTRVGVFQPTTDAAFGENLYYSSGWKYIATAAGSAMYLDTGGFSFLTAPSGSADAAATVTSRMTISNAGAVSILGGAFTVTNNNCVLTSAGQFKVDSTATATGTAVVHNANGFYYDLTSSRRFKENFRAIPNDRAALDRFLKLTPEVFDVKNGIDKDVINFIAEDAADAEKDGLLSLTNYNEDGEAQSLRDYSFSAYQQLVLQDHEARLSALQADFEAYKSSHP